MHIAPTREQAFAEVEYGIHQWVDYFRNVVVLPLAPEEPDSRKWAQAMVDVGLAVIGTPDDAAAQLERLEKQTAGYGAFLLMAHDWADPHATLRSYELLAQEVFPSVQRSADRAIASREWCREDHDKLIGSAITAVTQEIEKYAEETGHVAAVARLDETAK